MIAPPIATTPGPEHRTYIHVLAVMEFKGHSPSSTPNGGVWSPSSGLTGSNCGRLPPVVMGMVAVLVVMVTLDTDPIVNCTFVSMATPGGKPIVMTIGEVVGNNEGVGTV